MTQDVSADIITQGGDPYRHILRTIIDNVDAMEWPTVAEYGRLMKEEGPRQWLAVKVYQKKTMEQRAAAVAELARLDAES